LGDEMAKKKSKRSNIKRPPRHVASKGFDRLMFFLWQFTWGLPVNIIGLLAFLVTYRGRRHEKFCNSVITYIPGNWGGVSLGIFIFMCEGKDKAWEHDTKIHEYGHTIQCLLLGVFYWLVIGIPSSIWCNFPPCVKYRKKNNVSYYSLYCEKWANSWGERWSRQKRGKLI
jgi:hypothetical protein